VQNGELVERVDGTHIPVIVEKVTAASAGTLEKVDPLRRRLEALVNKAKCVVFIKGTPQQPRCGESRIHDVTFVGIRLQASAKS